MVLALRKQSNRGLRLTYFPFLCLLKERKRRLNLADLLNNIELEIISKLKWEWKLELIPFTPTSACSFQFVEYALNHLLMKETTTTTTTCNALPHGMCRSTVHWPYQQVSPSCCCCCIELVVVVVYYVGISQRLQHVKPVGWEKEWEREREQVQKTSETGRESACLLRFWFRCRPYQSREYYIDRWAIQVDMKSRNWVNAFLRWLCTLLVVVFIELFIKFCVLCKLPLCRRCICHTLKQNCFLFVFLLLLLLLLLCH